MTLRKEKHLILWIIIVILLLFSLIDTYRINRLYKKIETLEWGVNTLWNTAVQEHWGKRK